MTMTTYLLDSVTTNNIYNIGRLKTIIRIDLTTCNFASSQWSKLRETIKETYFGFSQGYPVYSGDVIQGLCDSFVRKFATRGLEAVVKSKSNQ